MPQWTVFDDEDVQMTATVRLEAPVDAMEVNESPAPTSNDIESMEVANSDGTQMIQSHPVEANPPASSRTVSGPASAANLVVRGHSDATPDQARDMRERQTVVLSRQSPTVNSDRMVFGGEFAILSPRNVKLLASYSASSS